MLEGTEMGGDAILMVLQQAEKEGNWEVVQGKKDAELCAQSRLPTATMAETKPERIVLLPGL